MKSNKVCLVTVSTNEKVLNCEGTCYTIGRPTIVFRVLAVAYWHQMPGVLRGDVCSRTRRRHQDKYYNHHNSLYKNKARAHEAMFAAARGAGIQINITIITIHYTRIRHEHMRRCLQPHEAQASR